MTGSRVPALNDEDRAVVAIAEVLAAHFIRPDGVCFCGARVNDGARKGLARARMTTLHRARVLAAAGFRLSAPPRSL